MQLVEEEEEEERALVERGSGVVSRVGGLASGSSVVYERVGRLASGSAVVVFSLSGCCMCHVVKHLLLGLGVGPAVYELDQLRGGAEIQAALLHLLRASSSSSAAAVPAVFVGGQLVGGLEQVMSCHINGSLVPLLKQAGALWL